MIEGMNQVVVFATGLDDAKQTMAAHGLDFDKTLWVLNWQLLGGMDVGGALVIMSELFEMMPASHEVRTHMDSDGRVSVGGEE